jgi:hypothetical protein
VHSSSTVFVKSAKNAILSLDGHILKI